MALQSARAIGRTRSGLKPLWQRLLPCDACEHKRLVCVSPWCIPNAASNSAGHHIRSSQSFWA
jgi:hypothetical protein